MATDVTPPKKSSLGGFLLLICVAGAIGVGGTYVVAKAMRGEDADAAPSSNVPMGYEPNAPAAAPPAATKLEFVGLGNTKDGRAVPPSGGEDRGVTLRADDATVVWFRDPGFTPPEPAPASGTSPEKPSPRVADLGGGAGRLNATLRVQDEAGKPYSFSLQRGEGDLVVLRIKRGYDRPVPFLKISQMDGEQEIGSWKVEKLPAPVQEIPESEPVTATLGVIRLSEGRGGQVGASLHLTGGVSADQGLIVRPIAASYTPIAPGRNASGQLLTGPPPQDVPLPIPNARMAKKVMLEMTAFRREDLEETVTLKSGRIEERFGEPVFVVTADETVTTSSGIQVTLPKQDNGPKRAPKKPRMGLDMQVTVDMSGMARDLPALQPAVSVELVSPTAKDLGVAWIALADRVEFPAGSQPAFPTKPVASTPRAQAGTPKYGPVQIVLRLSIGKPKLLSTRRVTLPVDPKIVPAPQGGGGGGGGPAMSPPPALGPTK